MNLGGRAWGGRRGWEMGEEVKDNSGTKTRDNQKSRLLSLPVCHPVVILDL